LRLLLITSYYKPAYVYGGPVRSISTLCEAMVKLGAQVTVLTTDANGDQRLKVPLQKSTQVDGVEVYYYPVRPGFIPNFFYSPSLARGIKEKIPDFDIAVLEVFFTHAMGPAVNACRRAGVPYIVSLRGQLLPWSLKQKWFKKRIYHVLLGRAYLNHAAALHCTDRSEEAAIRKLGFNIPTFVVPNGLDCRRFLNLPARGIIRHRFNIPEDAKLLLFLGRLHPKKRPDIAIEALASAQSFSPGTHLLLAGPDEMQLAPKLRAQAEQSGCHDKVHIAGLLDGDDLLSALADADLFLMPSEPESENFGMSALEAMAAGLPILVSEGVPVGRDAELAGAGWVVPATASAFTQVTRELLADAHRLKEMGREGQILVRQKYDISKVAERMMRQYEAIIATGRPLPEEELPLRRAG